MTTLIGAYVVVTEIVTCDDVSDQTCENCSENM